MAYVDSDGWQIWYEATGSGPPLVCTGGTVMMHDQFMHVTSLLARHFTVIHWNWRGAGQSDRTWVQGIHYDHFVRDLDRVLTALNVRKAHFWQAGMNAITLRHAALHPGRVDRLVLFPYWKSGPKPQPDHILELGRRERTMDRPLWAMWYAVPSQEAIESGEVTKLARLEMEMARRNTPFEVYERVYGSFFDMDFSRDVSRLRAPVQLLVGASGRWGAVGGNSAPLIDGFRELCPAAQVEVIPKSGGTIPMLEQPEATADAVIRFLKG